MHSYRIGPLNGTWEVIFDTGGPRSDSFRCIKTFRDEHYAVQLVNILNGGGESLEMPAMLMRLLDKGS